MQGPFEAVKITDTVYWVGAIDWALLDFHGYLTSRGTTYNAFLIMADTVTLIDTVKYPFKDEMLARISSVIDPARIDYIISNHAEMDHSGCLPAIIESVKPRQVYASTEGVKALQAHFPCLEGTVQAVSDGQNMSLGNMTVTFLETRMLHWPDSMVTYLHDERLLFSQDGFGMHLASMERFADELPHDVIKYETAKYYANILMPFSPLVTKLLSKVTQLGLEFSLIAPDHGPIWRQPPHAVLQWYSDWAAQRPQRKAVVLYDTMWHSTELMARALGDGIRAGGATVKLMSLKSRHRSDVATELLDAGALVVGSPTMNNSLFPTVADALTYLRGLKRRSLIGNAFGSFGWSGEAVRQIQDYLNEMKVELVGDAVQVKYVPGKPELQRCFELGVGIAQRLNEICQ